MPGVLTDVTAFPGRAHPYEDAWLLGSVASALVARAVTWRWLRKRWRLKLARPNGLCSAAVTAGAARGVVAARAANEPVLALATDQPVVTATTPKNVGVAGAVESIVAGTAREPDAPAITPVAEPITRLPATAQIVCAT